MKYDLIFSIGEACSCSSLIRSLNYQNYSYPFDWIAGCSFKERCKILANDFKDFINKEDLEYLQQVSITNNDVYKDKYNNIVFNHDFTTGIPFDEMYVKVKEKYDRRINRLLKNIEYAKNILLVYLETPTKNHGFIEDKELIDGMNILKEKYPNKNINLLYFTNSKDKKNIDITKDIKRVYLYYKDEKAKENYIPKYKYLQKILKKYKFKMSLKRKLQILLINSIPFRGVRKHYRKKYHINT